MEFTTAEDLRKHYLSVRERLGLRRVNADKPDASRLISKVETDTALDFIRNSAYHRRQERAKKIVERTRPRVRNAFDKMVFDLAERYGLPYNFHQMNIRTAQYISARCEVYYNATAMGLSYMNIARKCFKDHTTVRHSVLKYAKKHGLPLHIEKQ